ncbi:MAG: hypothetical protein KIT27_10245 [Legionellales bacterium]|nr:hypothetical protein [Legionellales bacterium]
MDKSNSIKMPSGMQERLQLRANSQSKIEKVTDKSLSESISQLTKMNAHQLRQLKIHRNGEFATCDGSKEALDIVNHVKSVLRSRGFGCYALHNHIWIVPFVHESIHIPDFEKAKTVLPDLKADLLGKAFPNQVCEENVDKQKTKASLAKSINSIIGLVGVLASTLTFLVYRAMNAR